MSKLLSRRTFLGDAALTGAAATLRLNPTFAAQAPAAETSARRTSFDDGWRFVQRDFPNAGEVTFDDSSWRRLDLPHDWSIEGDFREDAPAAGTGAYLPTGIGWYRKSFTLPAAARGQRIALEFDGVYQRSEVLINGTSLGMRPYGFISFSYNLTPHLNPPGKPNHLAVRVDNSLQPNCRWYSGSGIYRHTWLVITDAIHIAPWGVFVSTPSIMPASAEVAVTTRVRNTTGENALCELTLEVLAPDGTIVQTGTLAQTVPGGGEAAFSQTLKVASPMLWSTWMDGPPHLYQARCTLRMHGRELDRTVTPFGIRQIAFDADRGFLLNGRRVKMNGVCIHGDGGSVGAAVPERVWERRLSLLQEMGCNAIRLSHNPPAPELLDMLDRMGFLVMAEAFDEWRQPKGQTPDYGYHKYFDEWSQRDLAAMIERDRNHPSIVLWSAGNEVPDQTDPQGPATLQALLDRLHHMDSTRLVTVACDNIAAEPKATLPDFLARLDVVGYNYVDRWRDRREKMYSIDRQAYPQRRFIGTESIALYGARGVYASDQTNSLFFERASNTLIEVEQQQKFIQTYDYVSGDFIWIGIDYLGESKWPSKLAATGAIDTCGFRKDNFYFYQSIWRNDAETSVLHLATHWNWAGREGEVIPVICYTNCDTVELLLNGKSLGVKGFAFPRPGMTHRYGDYPPRARALQTTADLHLSWDVMYAPGILHAVGTRDGKVVANYQVQTTGPAQRIELTADRPAFTRKPGDVCEVTVRVLDAAGSMVPTADDEVTFQLHGEGRILGLDNGRPDSHERYQGSVRRAFSGMALAILQADPRRSGPGTMELAATAPGLTSSKVVVSVA